MTFKVNTDSPAWASCELCICLQEPGPGQIGAQAMQQLTAQRRKDLQKQRWGEYEEAFVALKGKVRDAEGQGMRETIQDKVLHTPSW